MRPSFKVERGPCLIKPLKKSSQIGPSYKPKTKVLPDETWKRESCPIGPSYKPKIEHSLIKLKKGSLA